MVEQNARRALGMSNRGTFWTSAPIASREPAGSCSRILGRGALPGGTARVDRPQEGADEAAGA